MSSNTGRTTVAAAENGTVEFRRCPLVSSARPSRQPNADSLLLLNMNGRALLFVACMARCACVALAAQSAP